MTPDIDALRRIEIDLPAWVREVAPLDTRLASIEDRMRLAIELSRQNVLRENNGPFGAAVFESATGRLVAAGVNSVVRLGNSALHAEVVALMFAQSRIGSYTLADAEAPLELVTSCEPCAMCLGAAAWSGVARVVCGAGKADAEACGFDEGPVFDESYRYLEARGLVFVRGVMRDEAADVLTRYTRGGGTVYNP